MASIGGVRIELWIQHVRQLRPLPHERWRRIGSSRVRKARRHPRDHGIELRKHAGGRRLEDVAGAGEEVRILQQHDRRVRVSTPQLLHDLVEALLHARQRFRQRARCRQRVLLACRVRDQRRQVVATDHDRDEGDLPATNRAIEQQQLLVDDIGGGVTGRRQVDERQRTLVVRQEPDGSLRRYSHIGTGNYNPKTARLYEDFGLLTADQAIGVDVADLFNHLSGYTRQQAYATLLVAPDTLRPKLLALIQREAAHARAGRPAAITMKLNNLVDETMIDALYHASNDGVQIDLVVRAICALRPGVPGQSENIRVRSILGRFLEHSRVFTFDNDGSPEFYMGSADMMHRNLDRRVEALVGITDEQAQRQLSRVLWLAISPDVRAWDLGADGTWKRSDGTIDFQQELASRRREAQ